jgi:hypothetical protein
MCTHLLVAIQLHNNLAFLLQVMIQIKPWGFTENAGQYSFEHVVQPLVTLPIVGIEFKRAAQQMHVIAHDVLLPSSTWQCPGNSRARTTSFTISKNSHQIDCTARAIYGAKHNLLNFGTNTGSSRSICFICKTTCENCMIL